MFAPSIVQTCHNLSSALLTTQRSSSGRRTPAGIGGAAVAVVAIIASLLFAGVPDQAGAAVFATVSGAVFADTNNNGVRDLGEIGIPGVTISAFADANAAAGSATTDLNGGYTLQTTVEGPWRVEVTAAPGGYSPSSSALSTNSTVRFASGDATFNFGMLQRDDYIDPNPLVAVAPMVNGDPLGFADAGNAGSLFTLLPTGNVTQRAVSAELGTTWGMAWQRRTDSLYLGSYLRRHAGLGPGGLGAIYRVVGPTTANPIVSQFIDVRTLSTPTGPIDLGTIASNADRGLLQLKSKSFDAEAFTKVGKVGLGDIDLSPDESTLWAVNLNTRSLIKMNVTAGTAPTTAEEFPIAGLPGAPACSNGTLRPFGLKILAGIAYVGVVCSADFGDDTDLRAYVLSFDPAAPSTLSTVLDIDLSYQKGQTTGGSSTAQSRYWHAWYDGSADADWALYSGTADPLPTSGNDRSISRPMPILSDLEIDNNGDLVLAFRDRAGDMFGVNNYWPTTGAFTIDYRSGGDILKACATTPGSWVLESNGSCGGDAGAGVGTGEGPGGGEFYQDWVAGFGHNETALGGLVNITGQSTIVATNYDAGNWIFTQGANWYSNATGTQQSSVKVVEGQTADAGHFGKSNGLGDIEALTQYAPPEIGNRVWLDSNFNGIQDASEAPIEGVTVELWADTDNDGIIDAKVGTAVTDSDGNYLFVTGTDFDGNEGDAVGVIFYQDVDGRDRTLAPGTHYEIRLDSAQDNVKNYDLTQNNATDNLSNEALTDVNDSDAALVDALAVIELTTSASGVANHSYDFGFTPPTSNIGDLVWYDANHDGVQDPDEPGIDGVVLSLSTASGGSVTDAFGNLVDNVTTDEFGNYSFTNLLPGTYVVTIVTAPSGYAPTLEEVANATTTTENDSSTGAATSIAVTAGVDDLTLDFGFWKPTSVGDFVWADLNHDGVQGAGEPGIAGVVLSLRDSAGNLVLDADGNAIANAITDASGHYSFDGLPPGAYTVAVVTGPAGMQPTIATAGAPATDSSTGSATSVALLAGESDDSLDFGFWAPASIGNFVWQDLNNNGRQDNGEPGVSGVPVSLLDAKGTVIATTTTDASGSYLFSALVPGDYTVQFTPPTGMVFVPSGMGTNADDSNANTTTGKTAVIHLASGADLSIDAGLVQSAAITGSILDDADNSSTASTGDVGLGGVEIALTGTDVFGRAVTLTTTTKADGSYAFTGLAAGTYTVTATYPTGYTRSAVLPGTAGGEAGPTFIGSITLAAGTTARANDFVLAKTTTTTPTTTPTETANPLAFSGNSATLLATFGLGLAAIGGLGLLARRQRTRPHGDR